MLSLQALHENVIHSIRSGLITTDLHGRVTLLNAPGQKLLQRTASAVYGRHIAELFLEDRSGQWQFRPGITAWMDYRSGYQGVSTAGYRVRRPTSRPARKVPRSSGWRSIS